MKTKIHPTPVLSRPYQVHPLEDIALGAASRAEVGIVRIGEGIRSPAEGFRTSARHEIAFLLDGRVCVETVGGSRVVEAQSVIVSSPTELHATTALTDATIFYVLIDPNRV